MYDESANCCSGITASLYSDVSFIFSIDRIKRSLKVLSGMPLGTALYHPFKASKNSDITTFSCSVKPAMIQAFL